MRWLGKFGLGFGGHLAAASDPASVAIAQGSDDDVPTPGQQFTQFGAGCFWGVNLAFQRVPGVSRTEVGYTQGVIYNPTYEDVCGGATGHSEVVRLEYDPAACRYKDLLDVFWVRHDPTTLNRQEKMTDIQLGAHTLQSHGFKVARLHMHDWIFLLLLVALDVALNLIEHFHRFIGEYRMTDLKYPFITQCHFGRFQ